MKNKIVACLGWKYEPEWMIDDLKMYYPEYKRYEFKVPEKYLNEDISTDTSV